MAKFSPTKGSMFRSNRIMSFAGWDNVVQIMSTLRDLEFGQFQNASILSDQFGREDRIDGVLRTRVDELLSTQLDILPSDATWQKAVKVASMLGGVEDGPGEWDRMFPAGVMSKLLRTGLCVNFAVAQILWVKERDILWPRLRFWNSQFVRWDEVNQAFMLRQYSGPEIQLPRLDQNPIGDGQWFVWCPFGYQEAWLGGFVRALAPMYMRRMWLNRDWARSSELYGQGIVKAIVPGGLGDDPEGDAFFDMVANRGADSTVKCPQGVDGQKYDVELEVAAQKIYETFRDGKGDVNTDIAVTILGQNLTTQSPGGGMSNGGDQKGPRAVMLNKARQDAAIAVAIRDQVLVPFARFNFGDEDLAPMPIYRVEPPEDENQKAIVLKAVGDAVKACVDANVPIDIRATSDEFGITQISEEEQAAREAVAAEEKAAQMKMLGLNNGDAVDGKGGGAADGGAEGRPSEPGKDGKKAALSALVVARRQFAGLPIAIENARGTVRRWTDADGNETGSTLMHNDYGFIEDVIGSDGEEMDCYLGPSENAADVHVVHQLDTVEFSQRLSSGGVGDAEGLGDSRDRNLLVEQAKQLSAVKAEFSRWSGGAVSSALQAQVDSSVRDRESFGNGANGSALGTGLDGSGQIPVTRSAVLSSVVGLLHDLKIRNIIVESVPVDMVNDLISLKFPPDRLFHNYPVLQALATSVVNEAIARLSAKRPDVTVGPLHKPDDNSSLSKKLKYSEDKVMLGFNDAASAKYAFLIHRNDGARSFGGMSTIPLDRFKAKLARRTGTGKVRAAADTTFAAIMALADMGSVAALGGKKGRGKPKADYPARVTANAIRLGARALAVDLKGLQADISETASFKDLERTIIERYRTKMDHTDFARVIQRCRLMSRLAGDLQVRKGA